MLDYNLHLNDHLGIRRAVIEGPYERHYVYFTRQSTVDQFIVHTKSYHHIHTTELPCHQNKCKFIGHANTRNTPPKVMRYYWMHKNTKYVPPEFITSSSYILWSNIMKNQNIQGILCSFWWFRGLYEIPHLLSASRVCGLSKYARTHLPRK